MSNSSKIGTIGEKKAAAFLKESGYAVIEQNYRLPWGEVDLIAHDTNALVFCEVKTWNCFGEENLEKAVGRGKQRKIISVAKHFIRNYPEYEKDRIRFDVILVKDNLSSIKHIKNAFGVNHG